MTTWKAAADKLAALIAEEQYKFPGMDERTAQLRVYQQHPGLVRQYAQIDQGKASFSTEAGQQVHRFAAFIASEFGVPYTRALSGILKAWPRVAKSYLAGGGK